MNRIDKFFDSIKDKKVAFCGLGISNFPVMEMFVKRGIDVTACDRRDFDALGDNGKKAQEMGVKLSLGEDYLKNLDVDIVFRTPGMRYYMDELVEMKNRGVVITSEMELFFELCNCKIIAITGSDGKTKRLDSQPLAPALDHQSVGHPFQLGLDIQTALASNFIALRFLKVRTEMPWFSKSGFSHKLSTFGSTVVAI